MNRSQPTEEKILSEAAYVGIDVAFAKRKRLPICVCVWRQGKLVPIRQKAGDLSEIPRGLGNKVAVDHLLVKSFTAAVKEYLQDLEEHCDISIRRIALDAPSSPKAEGSERRKCEEALSQRKISCFTTPSASEFDLIKDKVHSHFKKSGSESTIPHANQLWMLVGFELFKQLSRWDCIEVYPQATMRLLGVAGSHKSDSGAPEKQLQALSLCTAWPATNDPQPMTLLKDLVRAPAHDAVDAYACALVAGLGEPDRTAIGGPKDDTIWVPSDDWVARRRKQTDAGCDDL